MRRRQKIRDDVQAASRERGASEAALEHAQVLVGQLERIREANHFAESLRRLVSGEPA